MINPFKYGQIVNGEYFCRRPILQDKIRNHILSKQNIHIEGERRTGKTSLILETVNGLPKGNILFHTDFFQVKSLHDIHSRILDSITKTKGNNTIFKKLLSIVTHLKPTVCIDENTGSPSLSIVPSQTIMPDNITGLLDFIYNEFSNHKTVTVFFDEFQDILDIKESDTILALMRSRIQLHDTISYIYAGSIQKNMCKIFNDPASPFYKSALPIEIDRIDTTEFSHFIKNKFQKGKRSISYRDIEKIIDTSNYIPGDIMEYCNALWSITNENETINHIAINRALTEIFSHERQYFESVISQLTDTQHRTLKGVAYFNGKDIFSKNFLTYTGITQPSTVKRSLNKLESIRIVYLNKNGLYRFSNPFFRLWLLS